MRKALVHKQRAGSGAVRSRGQTFWGWLVERGCTARSGELFRWPANDEESRSAFVLGIVSVMRAALTGSYGKWRSGDSQHPAAAHNRGFWRAHVTPALSPCARPKPCLRLPVRRFAFSRAVGAVRGRPLSGWGRSRGRAERLIAAPGCEGICGARTSLAGRHEDSPASAVGAARGCPESAK
jgi:hypothetical protein